MMAEPGYYCTQLESAVHFIDTLDASRLTIDPEEFNRYKYAQQCATTFRRAALTTICLAINERDM
jgi:hypothetical protein